LFSLGTNNSSNAPRSGVKRMMERMWFCIRAVLGSQYSVGYSPLAAG
jgi:hypothetical protein